MPIEIERKFLLAESSWRDAADGGRRLRQAYLVIEDNISVRVRIIDETGATLAVKLPKSGLSRFEFEREISVREAETMIELCGGQEISKIRYQLEHEGSLWEVDDYRDSNEGLVVAEIELTREDQPFTRPPWLGAEVTGVERYQNSVLAQRPFQSWSREESLLETA